jgi:hypothetical protein
MPAPPAKVKYFDMGRNVGDYRETTIPIPKTFNQNITIDIQPFKVDIEELERMWKEAIEKHMNANYRPIASVGMKIEEAVREGTPYGNLYRRKLRIRR